MPTTTTGPAAAPPVEDDDQEDSALVTRATALRRVAAMRLCHLPLHRREAGVKKAEKAIDDLTAAAYQLNLGDLFTEPLAALWDALHTGGAPKLVRYKTPTLDKPHHDPTRKQKRGERCNLDRIASPEGQQALREVLDGLISQRGAARKLGVHGTTFCAAVRKLRQERRRQRDAATAPSFADAN
jgi:hypothetical protein